MKRNALAVLLILALVPVKASAQHGAFMRFVDNIIDHVSTPFPYDTTYSVENVHSWQFPFDTSVDQDVFNYGGTIMSSPFQMDLKTSPRVTHSIGFRYRGIGLSFRFNPYQKSNKDKVMNLALYFKLFGQRFHGTLFSYKANSLKGDFTYDGIQTTINPGDVKKSQFGGELVWIANSRKYAQPAATNQKAIQRESAGSFLVSTIFQQDKVTLAEIAAVGIPENQSKAFMWTLGGGYGYNWPFAEKWLVHARATENLILVGPGTLTYNGTETKYRTKLPSSIIKTNVGIYHWSGAWYYGAAFDNNFYWIKNNIGQTRKERYYAARIILGYTFDW